MRVIGGGKTNENEVEMVDRDADGGHGPWFGSQALSGYGVAIRDFVERAFFLFHNSR